MIEVEVNGSIYSGRLEQLSAQTESFVNLDGKVYYKNYGYQLRIMDANGVEFDIHLDELNKITFLG